MVRRKGKLGGATASDFFGNISTRVKGLGTSARQRITVEDNRMETFFNLVAVGGGLLWLLMGVLYGLGYIASPHEYTEIKKKETPDKKETDTLKQTSSWLAKMNLYMNWSLVALLFSWFYTVKVKDAPFPVSNSFIGILCLTMLNAIMLSKYELPSLIFYAIIVGMVLFSMMTVIVMHKGNTPAVKATPSAASAPAAPAAPAAPSVAPPSAPLH